MITLALEPA